MTTPRFPFAALVGQDGLKLALQLAAVDRRLSVLIRGDKGAGKSTAARGLADLLDESAAFVNLPLGATDDRLLGGLDVERALKGEPALKRGLLGQAHRGVLYIDEVNLLSDHLADALLDAAASGVHLIEREGFSAVEPADFVLVGSMNPEEGALRPQLLDRFAFVVDVAAPMDPAVRSAVVQRRLEYDADVETFAARWREESASLARGIRRAREIYEAVTVSADVASFVADRVVEARVRSLRADLAAIRGSRALAALRVASAVEIAHVEAVLPLVLVHRRGREDERGRRTHQAPDLDPPSPPNMTNENRTRQPEWTFAATPMTAPRVAVRTEAGDAGASARSSASPGGPVVSIRRTSEPRELDARATLAHAAVAGRSAGATLEDLHERVRAPEASVRYVFVIDSSGSHAAHGTMPFVKGAVRALLDRNRRRHDDIVIIGFRGTAASVLVEPTSDHSQALRALDYLPTGGRTPLAHALELAAGYVTDSCVLVVLTDGRANVPTKTDDAWADALEAASALRRPTIIVDSEPQASATGRPRELAAAMRAVHVRLSDLDAGAVLHLLDRIR